MSSLLDRLKVKNIPEKKTQYKILENSLIVESNPKITKRTKYIITIKKK